MKLRNFISFALVCALVQIQTGCSSTQVRETASSAALPTLSPTLPPQIIDVHTHLDLQTAEQLEHPYQDFIEYNVAGVVSHLPYREVMSNERYKDFPVSVGYCAAITEKLKVVELERGIKEGRIQCLTVYLGYAARYANDPFYHPYFKVAEKFGIPVVFNAGDAHDKHMQVKFADPLPIDDVAVIFPKVKFVIAHMGKPWYSSAAEVVYKNDNVYADCSGLMYGDLSLQPKDSVQELVTKPVHWFYLYVSNPKKLLFASGWPLTKVGPYIEAIKEAIPSEHWPAIFHDNAMRVFNIPMQNLASSFDNHN